MINSILKLSVSAFGLELKKYFFSFSQVKRDLVAYITYLYKIRN